MSGQTVFVQFRYCHLCQINHKKGKKHVYSKRHKDLVSGAVTKLLKKISESREFLKKPSVKDLTWDLAEQKFWCYFCQEDVKKHRHNVTTYGNCVVEYGGLLEHITRSDHLENTTKFLKDNKLEMKRTTEFIISQQVYLKYLEDIDSACSQFFMLKSQELKQAASQIKSMSVIRQNIVSSSIREQILLQQGTKQQHHRSGREVVRSKPGHDSLGSEERGKKTIQAFGAGLTPLDGLDEDDSDGNIYTNAVPPWMQSDDKMEACTGVVGPTIEDLDKHRKLERKRQLPACRVGAKFDRKSEQTELWLPDFGGVWNHGRRTKSSHPFLRRQPKQARTAVHPSEAMLTEKDSSLDTPLYSYSKISKSSAAATLSSDTLNNNNHSHSDIDIPSVYADSLSSSYSLPFCNSKSDSFNSDDWQSVKSQSLSDLSGKSSTVLNSSPHVTSSMMINNDNFVQVKPYVKKNRIMPCTVSEQNSSRSLFSSNVSVPHPSQTYNRSMGNVNVQNSSPYGIMPPPFLPFENHISSRGWDRKLIGNVYQEEKYVNMPYVHHRIWDSTTSHKSVRLITTPVLNQDKCKVSAKKSSGS